MTLLAMAGCGPIRRATRKNTDGSITELVLLKSRAGASSYRLIVKKNQEFSDFCPRLFRFAAEG